MHVFRFFKTSGCCGFLFKCKHHPLERLWAAKFLKSGRRTCDCSRKKSMDYFTEHLRWKGPTTSPAPQGMAHVGIRAVPWLALAPISDQLSQAQARSWGLSPVCSYSTPISMDLKLLWKHRNWELQFLTQLCLLAAPWTSKKIFICCTPGHHEILPCQALHPYPGFHWKKEPGVQARRALQIFLTESRYQEKANEPDMDPCGASLRSAGLHWDTKSRWRKPCAEPELILSIFWRDCFFVTVIQKLLLIVLELICWTAMLPKLIKTNRKLPCLFQEYWKNWAKNPVLG